MDIIIDTAGETELVDKSSCTESSESESDCESDYEVPENFSVSYKTSLEGESKRKNPKDEDIDFEDTYLDMNIVGGKQRTSADLGKSHTSHIDEILKKSVIQPGFEKNEVLPPYEVSKRKLQKERKKEREKNKGTNWFNMPATEITEDMKHDLEILQMRSVLDPKHFYKKSDLKVLPKYFQVGRIVETPADFYHSRIPKKQRKKTIVDELLADAEFKRYNKRKYKEIIEETKKKGHSRAHKHAKKLKKKNK